MSIVCKHSYGLKLCLGLAEGFKNNPQTFIWPLLYQSWLCLCGLYFLSECFRSGRLLGDAICESQGSCSRIPGRLRYA